MTREQLNIIECRERRSFTAIVAVVFFSAILLAGIFILSPSDVWAAGPATGGSDHVASVWDIRFFWINFLIFIALGYFLLRNTVRAGWQARANGIKELAEQGARAREAAQARLHAAQARLSRVDAEIKGLRQSILEDTEREFASIIEHDRSDGIKLQRQAHNTLETESRALKEQIKLELTAQILERVKDRVNAGMNSELDAKLRDAALSPATVGALLN